MRVAQGLKAAAEYVLWIRDQRHQGRSRTEGMCFSVIAVGALTPQRVGLEGVYHNLMWVATGERLTKETFQRYRKQGGLVIVFNNTEDMIDLILRDPLPMIAPMASAMKPAIATRARPERIRGFWVSTCANATSCRSMKPSAK
jgi:hypothetical protein